MKVYQAINRVQAELAKDGIAKNRSNAQQGYKFRGIDDVYNALATVLASHGLCVLPRMLSRECVERQTKSGSALFYVTVEAEFDLVAAEDGSRHTIRTYGEAMDSGDKATNKAMSAAYKYACMQAFAIPTEGDNDADAVTHEVKARIVTPTDGVWDSLDADTQVGLQKIALNVGDYMAAGDAAGAWRHIAGQKLGTDEKAGLWTLLDSKTRTALKKAADAAKEVSA